MAPTPSSAAIGSSCGFLRGGCARARTLLAPGQGSKPARPFDSPKPTSSGRDTRRASPCPFRCESDSKMLRVRICQRSVSTEPTFQLAPLSRFRRRPTPTASIFTSLRASSMLSPGRGDDSLRTRWLTRSSQADLDPIFAALPTAKALPNGKRTDSRPRRLNPGQADTCLRHSHLSMHDLLGSSVAWRKGIAGCSSSTASRCSASLLGRSVKLPRHWMH